MTHSGAAIALGCHDRLKGVTGAAMLVDVLLDTTIHVHYGFLTLAGADEDAGGMPGAYRGQVNGLCGAAVPGSLHMHTGLHTGDVGVRIELHADEPGLDDAYQDAVEVFFTNSSEELMLSAFDSGAGPVDLPAGIYRARYCAKDMQLGRDLDTSPD
jgi:hypothetical protein